MAGGKGASLASLCSAGFNVPAAFIVSADAFALFLEHHELSSRVKRATTSRAQADKLTGEVLARPLPPDLAKELRAAFRALKAERVAVRSSSAFEDGQSRSWAGQFETLLNVTEGTLEDAVKRCWASRFNARVLTYLGKGARSAKPSMAVVVQKLIESDAAGVAFSLHPVSGDKNQVVLEAAHGLGEALVSGRVTPERFVFSKKPLRVVEHVVGKQREALRAVREGGTRWMDAGTRARVLTESQAREVAQLVMELEKKSKHPVDVEWAVFRKKLFLLQSRPVTT